MNVLKKPAWSECRSAIEFRNAHIKRKLNMKHLLKLEAARALLAESQNLIQHAMNYLREIDANIPENGKILIIAQNELDKAIRNIEDDQQDITSQHFDYFGNPIEAAQKQTAKRRGK